MTSADRNSSWSNAASATPGTNDEPSTKSKKTRVHRACDACRKRKVRCEGPQNSQAGGKCPFCIQMGKACTYLEDTKRPKGPSKGYVTMLEQKCGRMKSMLYQASTTLNVASMLTFLQLCPSIDLESYIGTHVNCEDFNNDSYLDDLHSRGIPPYPALKPLSLPSPQSSTASYAPPSSNDTTSPESTAEGDNDEYRLTQTALVNSMHWLKVRDAHWRYHGKSSNAQLVMQIQDLKYQKGIKSDFIAEVGKAKREAFWEATEWERFIDTDGTEPLETKAWPERGLDQMLINAYFDKVDFHVPLLNRLIFQEQYDAKLWRTNEGFARLCMLVFANGSHFVQDPRVLWQDDSSTIAPNNKFSGGWKYFRAVLRMGHNIMQLPTLFDIQCLVLTCSFIHTSSSTPQRLTTVAALGLQSIQELGAHVSAVLAQWDPVERALYHRAFWCLYHIDRYGSATVGRPVAILDSEFDVPELADIDDEYWERQDSDGGGTQPKGKVSRVAFFIEISKVDRIIGRTLTNVYGIRTPVHVVVSKRAMATELDAELTEWAKNVPLALQWDPDCSNYSLLCQSAHMWAQGHFARILIHRIFVPPHPNTGTLEQLSSLTSCIEAAYAICGITDALLVRGRHENCPPGHAIPVILKLPSWVSGIILLLALYTTDLSQDEVHRVREGLVSCMRASQELEVLWQRSGKVTDFLERAVAEADLFAKGMAQKVTGPGVEIEGVSLEGELGRYLPKATPATPSSYLSPDAGKNDGKKTQQGLYDSWLRMSTFQSQLLNMDIPMRAREEMEEGIGDDWWAKMLGAQK
ncbi:hypothetical protein I350_05788 [Cryptococcus amylolentus CBS 6273]|uniref:Zn(2)-C6 fungal-type domain-containing protein n=1 Tax=Cryptococcus amylolentus CBS 6273 TaxID=1296118 RepID=A0A1E3JQL7_9TREE|nr:hypothetical protein I350_05788 [Cryptococcus amylolentus CBS 6273]